MVLEQIDSCVQDYIERGWPVIPLVSKQKFPIINSWQNLEITDENKDRYFSRDGNVGLKLGMIVDVDLDCLEAIELAPSFIPETGAIFGRRSKPRSHYLYNPVDEVKSHKYQSPTFGVILEIRSTGEQTMLPGSIHPSGEIVRWDSDQQIGVVYNQSIINCVGKLAAASLLAKFWIPGNRNSISLHLSGALLNSGWSEYEIAHLLQALCDVTNDIQVENRLGALKATIEKRDAGEFTTGWPSLAESIGETNVRLIRQWLQIKDNQGRFALTDKGNAERYIDLNQETLRYCPRRGYWFVWDGKRWETDFNYKHESLALKVSEAILEESHRQTDGQLASITAKWASASQNATRVNAIPKLARSNSAIQIENDSLDSNPWLITCLNGTVNLRSGGLQPHSREDFCTKLAQVEYDPSAQSAVWDEFINKITDGSEAVAQYLRRVIGYCITGETLEDAFFIAWGPTRTGKSTFVNAIRETLGDYATTARPEVFLPKRNDIIPTEIADLAGSRLVFTTETEANQRFTESLVKQMTGGDRMKARFLYEHEFEFKPSFKIWLATNNKPALSANDFAVWERVRLIPFTHRIDTIDRSFRDELPRNHAKAIFAWMVRGCLEWQQYGLSEPDEVTNATGEYQEEMDKTKVFLSDCCTVETTSRVQNQKLYGAYIEWCRTQNERPISVSEFKRDLENRGFENRRFSSGNMWIGLKLNEIRMEDDRQQPTINDNLSYTRDPFGLRVD